MARKKPNRMSRRNWLLVVAGCLAVTALAYWKNMPDATIAVAGPTPVTSTPPLPTNVPGVLALSMPIDPGDSSNNAFVIAPFGYHGPVHAEDGHPGWEIEYRAGASARAAAAGTIESVVVDPFGRFTVQIEHAVGTHFYRTTYTNLLIKKQPMDFYFKPQPGGFKDNILRVAPDILPQGSIKIGEVWVDGQPYADFDAAALTVKIPQAATAPKIKVRIIPNS